MQIAGECVNGTDALRAVRELAPDVVVIGLGHVPGHLVASRATCQISMIAPLTRVLVLTISDQDADVMDAILAGACEYLLKGCVDYRPDPVQQLVDRRVLQEVAARAGEDGVHHVGVLVGDRQHEHAGEGAIIEI